jgi:hypothetical protein
MDPNDPFVEGSVVYMETNEMEGISFISGPMIISGQDRLSGEKQIILRGRGKPTSVDTKRLTISSNSAISVATCYVNVAVAYTSKKILGIGYTGTNYGYNVGHLTNGLTEIYRHGGRKMLEASANFGTDATSVIKVEGYSFVNGGSSPNATELATFINSNKPDVIVIGYNYEPSNAAVDVLLDYLSKKGVVIAAIEDENATKRLFTRTLNLPDGTITVSKGAGTSSGSYGDAGSIHTFSYMTNDEILNGPFGDVREKYWGEDASYTVGVTGVPPGLVDIYSDGNFHPSTSSHATRTTNRGNTITMCKFKGSHLVWLGDGGFWSRGLSSADVSSNIICPLYYDGSFRPVTGTFGYGDSYTIYNSFFFANVMAWAIKTAQFDGYNTPR